MNKFILASITILTVSSALAGPAEDYANACRHAGMEAVKNSIHEALVTAGKDPASMQIEVANPGAVHVIAFASNANDACKITGYADAMKVYCVAR